MKTLNMDFKPNKAILSATLEVLKAQAQLEVIQPIVENYQLNAIKLLEPKDETGQLITEPKCSYRMNNYDFKRYLDLCHMSAINSGFNVKHSYCPLLSAENNLRKARKTLIDKMAPITNIAYHDLCIKLDFMEQYIELTLNFLVPLLPENMIREMHEKLKTNSDLLQT